MSKSPDQFDIFAEEIRHRAEAWGTHHWYRSTINPDELWEAYLSGFSDPEIRQQHNCHCCKSFIKKYGGLVTTKGKELFSPLWPEYTDTNLYSESLENIHKLFNANRCSIKYPFYTDREILGTRDDDEGWTHFWVQTRAFQYHRGPTKHAAEKFQEHKMLVEYLHSMELNTISIAKDIFQSDSTLARSKHAGMANWLLDIRRYVSTLGYSNERRNYLWHVAMNAPIGYCHIKNTVVGTFIEDIEKHGIEEAKRKLNAMMNPLQYQRPQAAPTEGNIRAAEALFQKMNLGPSLERRYANLQDIQEFLWKPAVREEKAQGLFSHLSKEHKKMELPKDSYINNISWVVFARDVLPQAKSIRIKLNGTLNFAGLVTAVHADAEPILQWDRKEHRNPVSWYVYHGGSRPSTWALVDGEWADIVGVTLMPSNWNGCKSDFSKHVCLVIEGMRDARNSSASLFPEILRSELREVRATIEAYSSNACIQKTENPVGAVILPSTVGNTVIEVAGDVLRRYYRIDRWE